MNQSANFYLAVLIAFSVLVSGYSFYLGTLAGDIGIVLELMWFLVCSLLVTFWVVRDPAKHFESFDGSAWLFLFWPVVLPYYLWRYRGIEGLVIYLGILTLWSGYFVANLYGYWYFAH